MRLEIAVPGVMVTMIEPTIILIFVPGMLLPMLLVLMPMLGVTLARQRDAKSYQGN